LVGEARVSRHRPRPRHHHHCRPFPSPSTSPASSSASPCTWHGLGQAAPPPEVYADRRWPRAPRDRTAGSRLAGDVIGL
jgi:hypothetical protein